VCASYGDASDAARVSRRYMARNATSPSGRGQPDQPEWLVFQCEPCLDSFGIAIDRYEHERQAHTRNSGTGAAKAKKWPRPGGPGRTPTVWTQEETDLLLILDRPFQGDRRINMKILEFLPGKTRKQISDKHVHLGLTNKSVPTANDNHLEPPTNALLPDPTGGSLAMDAYVTLTGATYDH